MATKQYKIIPGSSFRMPSGEVLHSGTIELDEELAELHAGKVELIEGGDEVSHQDPAVND